MTKSKPKKMNTGGLAKSQKSLKSWTKQDWRTKSGKPSTQGAKATGERYLPKKAIKSLSSSEYAATTKAKRKGRAAGKQFVAQPKKIAAKVMPYISLSFFVILCSSISFSSILLEFLYSKKAILAKRGVLLPGAPNPLI